MKNTFLRLLVVALLVSLMSGCGALRSLTTKRISFGPYFVGEQNFVSPTAGDIVVTSHFTISGDVVRKYDKYHGGIDWAGLTYTATSAPQTTGGSVPDINVKLYASLTAPVGTAPNIQLPADATLIDEVSLTRAVPSVTKDADASHNEALRKFIEKALTDGSGDTRMAYVYFKASTNAPGRLIISTIYVKGVAHGSLF